MSPQRSVTPSRAFTVNGIGGFQPVATSREMSAFSRTVTNRPSAPRRFAIGGVSGFE